MLDIFAVSGAWIVKKKQIMKSYSSYSLSLQWSLYERSEIKDVYHKALLDIKD